MIETKAPSSNETMLLLLDNTVLSNFGQAGRSDLIFCLGKSASTTIQVLQEYQNGANHKKVPANAWRDLHLVTLTPKESTFMVEHLSNLGFGESSCIAVAYHRNGVVLTDDKQARKIAKKLGIQVSGTLGTLVFCVVEKIVTLEEANTILQRMIVSGYRSPTPRLETLLSKT